MLVGPSVAEVAALSTYRPLLAILLALGSPATYVTTLFQQVDVREPFDRPTTRLLNRWSNWVYEQNTGIRASLQAFYHIIAVLAIANNIQNSVLLDLRTICGWRCGVLSLPLGWSLSGILVHVPGMIAIRITLEGSYRPYLCSSIQSTTFKRVTAGTTSVGSDLLFWIATFCAVIQLIFGILDLASLVFISTLEALHVFMLHLASTLSCQAILLLELADMRRELSQCAALLGTSRSVERNRMRAYTYPIEPI